MVLAMQRRFPLNNPLVGYHAVFLAVAGVPNAIAFRTFWHKHVGRASRSVFIATSLAAGLALTACSSRYSNLPAAYKGRPFEDSHYMGGPQVIPGRVQAAYFDLGGEGVAYHDTDKVNHGSGELNHQKGHFEGIDPYISHFRESDGVDLSYVKQGADLSHTNYFTPEKNQFYVGWEEDGEWCNYTVDVKKAGTYVINILYGNTTNTIRFLLNNQPACECKLPMHTGSYHIWNLAAAAGRITFDRPGIQLLTLHYNKGNNLAWFDFILENAATTSSRR